MIMSASTMSGNRLDGLAHSHIDGTEPRIFPGVVHERIRRGSMRQGSSSEKDVDGFMGIGPGFSKLGFKEHTGDLDDTVAEE